MLTYKCILLLLLPIYSGYPIGYLEFTKSRHQYKQYESKSISFEKHQVWQMNITTDISKQSIHNLASNGVIDLWTDGSKTTVDFRVAPENMEKVKKQLSLEYSVMINDVQQFIDRQLTKPVILNNEDSMKPNFFKSFHNLEEIHSFMDALILENPEYIRKVSLGVTYEKRQMSGIQIGSENTTSKEILFHGGIHAREWIGPAVVTYIANQISEEYQKSTELGALLRKFQFTIIPVLNADGYVFTHEKNRMWRKNRQPNDFFCVGTDMNRNFGYKFGTGGSSKNPCAEDYQGPKAFSTQEASAIRDYVISKKGKVVSYIDFHAYSQLWMYPYGAECDTYPPDMDRMDKAGKAAASALKAVHGTSFAVGPICEIIYKASGSSVDWTYAEGNVTYSMAVELRDKGKYGFLLPPEQIIPSGEETWEGLKNMIKVIAELEGL